MKRNKWYKQVDEFGLRKTLHVFDWVTTTIRNKNYATDNKIKIRERPGQHGRQTAHWE